MADTPLWPLGDDPEGWPTVSVVMPIRNEAENLRAAVEAVLSQEYPRPFDVCLAVAPSDDGTEDLAQRLAESSDRVTVVTNAAGTTPAGLNAAIRATDGEVVVRVDGHSKLSECYIRRAVETMSATGAVNVGGIQHAIGQTPFEGAVAAAQQSWLGTGGARYRVGGNPGPVDTVYLGVFRRDAIEAVGLFDERLMRNQDYELNIRLRKASGTIWFDPELSIAYRPRGSLRSLAKQYYEYGWWKAEVARMHPSSLRPRQLIAILAGGATAAAVLSRLRSLAIASVTFAILCATAPRRGYSGRAVRIMIVPTMHSSWLAGLYWNQLLWFLIRIRGRQQSHTNIADIARSPE